MIALRWFADRLEHFLNFMIALLCLVLLTALFVQVVNRYVLAVSWPALQFIIPFCFVWLSMLGSAVAVRRKLHFEIDLFSEKLSPKVRRIHAVFVTGAVLTGGAIIGWTGIGMAELGLLKQDPATGLPLIYIYVSILVGGGLMCLLAIEQLLKPLTSRPAENSEAAQ